MRGISISGLRMILSYEYFRVCFSFSLPSHSLARTNSETRGIDLSNINLRDVNLRMCHRMASKFTVPHFFRQNNSNVTHSKTFDVLAARLQIGEKHFPTRIYAFAIRESYEQRATKKQRLMFARHTLPVRVVSREIYIITYILHL